VSNSNALVLRRREAASKDAPARTDKAHRAEEPPTPAAPQQESLGGRTDKGHRASSRAPQHESVGRRRSEAPP
jgi:hypothetical protein